LSDPDLRYTFTCPSCSGNFSILLERIPPIQARFRCPHCKQPMDFPSRDEARVYARLQAQTLTQAQAQAAAAGGAPTAPDPPVSMPEPPAPPLRAAPPLVEAAQGEAGEGAAGQRFFVEKAGFENDVFDRRAIRNLIRTGEIEESDLVRVDEAGAVPAGQVALLKSLFKLRATSSVTPPTRCRKHTERVAFFRCQSTARPLCEDCAPEKKFGQTTLRVCEHCGGSAGELVSA